MKKHIPNIITLINLLFGCFALVCIFYGRYNWVFIWLLLAGLADFADGLVARILNVHSPLGKELDSLADMVSFGVVPGAMYFAILGGTNLEGDLTQNWIPFMGFVVTLLSCYRLAKFNLDTRQTEDFIGLATPSSTVFATGLYLMYYYNSFGWQNIISNPLFLIPVILIMSYLLISEFRMFSFKFKSFQWKGNEFKFGLIVVAVLQMIFLREAAFSFTVLTYIIFAFFDNLRKKRA